MVQFYTNVARAVTVTVETMPDTTPAAPCPPPFPANPLRNARFLQSAARLTQLPADDASEVAFVGRSNAGKSSALNCLCEQRALARVSRTPGRTQLINLFGLAQPGRLVDLPGYGYAKAPPEARRNWEALVGRYVADRPNLAGLILLMDVRHPLQPLDWQMLDWARAYARPVHILLTKADKLGRGAGQRALKGLVAELQTEVSPATAQLFSAPGKQGVEGALGVIGGWLGIAVG